MNMIMCTPEPHPLYYAAKIKWEERERERKGGRGWREGEGKEGKEERLIAGT